MSKKQHLRRVWLDLFCQIRALTLSQTFFNTRHHIPVDIENGAYPPEHAATLHVAGLDKPRRKRGRPPKKHKTPEELVAEAAAKEREIQQANQDRKVEEISGKRKRKTPSRFQQVVQVNHLFLQTSRFSPLSTFQQQHKF